MASRKGYEELHYKWQEDWFAQGRAPLMSGSKRVPEDTSYYTENNKSILLSGPIESGLHCASPTGLRGID